MPEGVTHIVDGRRLCGEQYANYRENLGYRQGYKAGVEEVVRSLHVLPSSEIVGFLKLGITLCEWQNKLKEWGNDS